MVHVLAEVPILSPALGWAATSPTAGVVLFGLFLAAYLLGSDRPAGRGITGHVLTLAIAAALCFTLPLWLPPILRVAGL